MSLLSHYLQKTIKNKQNLLGKDSKDKFTGMIKQNVRIYKTIKQNVRIKI